MKKNQHYVFRAYLKSWSNNQIINTEFRGENKKINLTGVAQERYFYEMSELDNEDILFLIRIIGPESNELAKINTAWLTPFLLAKRLREQLTGNEEKDKLINSELDVIYKEIQEELHAHIESGGIPLIEMIKEKDLSFYDDSSLRARFCHFLCVQLYRTKKYKLRFLQLEKTNPEFRFERTWSIFSHIAASNVGLYVFKERYKFVILLNNGDEFFITSDQPVINMLSHLIKNPEQEDIELYYPVSPDVALLVTNSEKYENKEISVLEIEEVRFYNESIRRNSNEFVFYK